MDPINCRSIRDLLVSYFGANTEVTTANDRCIVTLPLTTLDDRSVHVYVQQTMADYVVVSDGGKSMAELFAQGIHLTETQISFMKTIARHYNATFIGNIFQIGCKLSEVQQSVVAIAQCAALAMVPVASHRAVIEDEPVSARIARSLHKWKPDYVDIGRREQLKGHHSFHAFDFVAHNRKRGASSIAIKHLPPSYGSHVQAQRYGFLALDGAGMPWGNWHRLAVITKREEWHNADVELVRQFSSDVIELETDGEERIEQILPGKMTELTEAA